jgi:Xaa-Pro aminopeptidase
VSYEERAGSLLNALSASGYDAAIITSLDDLRWLTGFTGSNGCGVVQPSGVTFVTDFRYSEQVLSEVPKAFTTVIADGPLRKEVAKAVRGGEKVCFDAAQISALDLEELKDCLPQGVELVPAKDLVVALRAVKDSSEIASIAEAAKLADAAFSSVISEGIIGSTEQDVAWRLEVAARELGASGMSFPSIVAGGAHGALPHAQPRPVEIAPNDLVVIDWGVVLDGYCSDCTRTVATGELGEKAASVYNLVNAAREAGLAAVAPGLLGSEVDAVARAVISDAGYGDAFGHGLGHGVGLEIHESPNLGKTGQTPLEAGMVVTVEPGIYLPGEFGVRIEDLLVVRPDGYEMLTTLGRELLTVG